MLLLALIGFVWLAICAMVIALCVTAKRADALVEAPALVPVAPEPQAVGWVATFAEPAPAPAPRVVLREAQRQSV